MGDAYLCCGWLSEDESKCKPTLAENAKNDAAEGASPWSQGNVPEVMVHDALFLARCLLTSVNAIGRRRQLDLHVRIGIATGVCVAGVMGQLQPRFHILGPAMSAVNVLEQHGQRDHIQVDHTVMSFLRREPERAGTAARGGEGEGGEGAVGGEGAELEGDAGGLYEARAGMGLWQLKRLSKDVAGVVSSGYTLAPV